MNLDKVVTADEIREYFGVSLRNAKDLGKVTRATYKKAAREKITLAQVRKANRLEP